MHSQRYFPPFSDKKKTSGPLHLSTQASEVIPGLWDDTYPSWIRSATSGGNQIPPPTTSEEFKEFNNVGGVQGGVQQVKYLRRRSSTTISTTEEFNNVTTLFNKSPSSLKDSKPTHRRGGALTSWNQRRVDSKLKYISENAFTCQRGGVFPEPSAGKKRLKKVLVPPHCTVGAFPRDNR